MARMGRTRISRKDLPSRMYLHHGSFYFVPKEGKKVNLGRDYGDAIALYGTIVQVRHERCRMTAVMDAYLKEKFPSLAPRTQADYLDGIKRLRPVFGEMWPEDIQPKHVYQYMKLRRASTRANREKAVLSNVMQQAIEMGLINSNPCKQVRRNKEVPATREVTEREIAEFLPFCPEWLQAYLGVKLLTGLRQGDMLRLTLFSIRDDGLFVETGKRKKRLLFEWTAALRTAVDRCKALRRKPSESRLFTISQAGFKSAWSRTMHDFTDERDKRFPENALRAKVATEAHATGLDATSMLGHSSDAVTRRHYIRGTKKVSPLK